MTKLFKLRDWLSVQDAAKHLSMVLEEDIAPADLLRCALEGRLDLSVFLVNPVPAKACELIEIIGDEPASKHRELVFLRTSRDEWNFDAIHRSTKLTHVRGLLDLPMAWGERLAVEAAYQRMVTGPDVDLSHADGTFVASNDGTLFQLQYCYSDDAEREHWAPDTGLPSDAILVIRTKNLTTFEQGVVKDHEGTEVTVKPTDIERPLAMRERESLQRMIIAMAVAGYSYTPDKRNGVAAEISADMTRIGMSMDEDTVRKHLKAAAVLMPAK